MKEGSSPSASSSRLGSKLTKTEFRFGAFFKRFGFRVEGLLFTGDLLRGLWVIPVNLALWFTRAFPEMFARPMGCQWVQTDFLKLEDEVCRWILRVYLLGHNCKALKP